MEDLGSMWDYEESFDELKQKLVYTTIELGSLKVEANEEMRKHKEDVNHLINLLKIAYQERDEAKGQLQKLVNKLMLSSTPELPPILPLAQPESPLVMPAKANSSITESNSLSDTYNHQSHGSSPVDSLLDAVTSPDFSSINMADSCHMGFVDKTLVQDYNGSIPTGLVAPAMAKIDPADDVIDKFVKGRVLPQKGKLLQAVMDTGPLLQTLLLAGPLPRWRNPPPLQPFNIPPVSISCETPNLTANSSCLAQQPLASPSYIEMSRGSSQMCSASMLGFAPGAGSGIGNGRLLNSGAIHQIPAGKRQRSQ
ncbi:hypothetical protein POPTR_009G027100v4 [Populus trichocarpa]|uniref:Uncharacterized protein n=1 Tax=Populus trichocarpa TaxID=3694 RepID=A0A2K1Z1R8_POPTR|nr:uncharacterized protein LOC7488140 [Populus trichocarpa]KAI5576080.1 hypothetical protein BDE02_09G020800 [Populus trichocarpa]PNT19224.1 hypothetical protein POPTR_009G027100v4 [Populus trichocarpa]|eukprot:XP_024463736.1 uncharacterized protein LOC7488140 [Populus trichocarpa]